MSNQLQSSPSPSSSKSDYPCSCGTGDGTGQYIKCDNEDCRVSWYHWECVHVTEQPAGTWLCPKCSPNASFYVKQLVKRRAASPPRLKPGKVAASEIPKDKESRSTSAQAATPTPAPAKDKVQKVEVGTRNKDGEAVKKGVAVRKPVQKKPKQKRQGWVELPSDEEEELKRKIDAEWAMENAVVGKRRRSSRLAAEESETSSYGLRPRVRGLRPRVGGLRPRVGGLRPRVEKKKSVKTDSAESSVENESSDEDESVYQEEVEEGEDEDEDEEEKSVTGIFSSDSSPDTNMAEDEDEEQSIDQEEEDDGDNDEGKSEEEGSSLFTPAAVPQTPSVVSISSTSPCSSSSDTMDVDEDLTPRQSDKSRADSQTPSPSKCEVKDDEDDSDEDCMEVAQDEHRHVSSNKSDSEYYPTSNREDGSDDSDVVSTSSDTPTLAPRSSERIDITSPHPGTLASPSAITLGDGDMETDDSSEQDPQPGTPASPLVIILRSPYDDSSEEHEPQPGTPASPSVLILRSPYASSEEHEPQPGTPASPSIILRESEMESHESEHEDLVFITVTPAVQFNPHAALYPNREEFVDNFPDSADRSTLPRLG